MAELVFLALSKDELAVLKNLGKVIIGNYNNVPVAEPEPTKEEFTVLAGVFARVMEMK